MICHISKVLSVFVAMAAPAVAAECAVDVAAVKVQIAELESYYGLVISTIGCVVPNRPGHQIMCAARDNPDDDLWLMGQLDDLAWLHAVENATGQEVDPASEPRDLAFLATRDACTDVACLCAALIDHTNSSLGGTSPYPQ